MRVASGPGVRLEHRQLGVGRRAGAHDGAAAPQFRQATERIGVRGDFLDQLVEVALRAITMPLLKPTLIGILFFVMLMSIKEISASLLLYTQNSQVLSVLTWHFMDAGNYQFAAAIGVIQTLMMMGLVIATPNGLGSTCTAGTPIRCCCSH